MSQPLPYGEIRDDSNIDLEELLNTPDDSDIDYFIEIDLSYTDNIKIKPKKLPVTAEKKITHRKFTPHTNKKQRNI